MSRIRVVKERWGAEVVGTMGVWQCRQLGRELPTWTQALALSRTLSPGLCVELTHAVNNNAQA